MASVVLSAEDLGTERGLDHPTYWSEENHTADSNYLRAEEWMQDVEEWTFQGLKQTVPLTYDAGQAILRYACRWTPRIQIPSLSSPNYQIPRGRQDVRKPSGLSEEVVSGRGGLVRATRVTA